MDDEMSCVLDLVRDLSMISRLVGRPIRRNGQTVVRAISLTLEHILTLGYMV